VTPADELGRQLVDDPFRAAVRHRRDTLERGRDLRNAQVPWRCGHPGRPGAASISTAAVEASVKLALLGAPGPGGAGH
jgi:hypothetical protein